MHPALRGHPTDLAKAGGLALERAGHTSPVPAQVEHDGLAATLDIEWLLTSHSWLGVLDSHRITEDGAEAVALAYANVIAGWVVKRRLQRGESADWLLRKDVGWLALEVSGMAEGDPSRRLEEKKRQVARCSLPAERMAVVVAFDRPMIAAGGV